MTIATSLRGLIALAALSTSSFQLLAQETIETEPINAEPVAEQLVNSSQPFLVDVGVDRADGKYTEGDTISVSFRSERESYIYLLYHQVDGQCLMVFPNKAQQDNKVQGQQVVKIPAEGSNFRFRVRPPFGAEQFQVLASAQQIEELAKFDTTSGVAVPVPQELLKALAERAKADRSLLAEHHVKLETLPDKTLEPTRPPLRAAMFFGVSKHANEEDNKQARPRYKLSCELLRQAMIDKGGILPEHARLLVDEDSTKANFEEAITNWLPSITQPGDTVFIYYQGHGGHIENLDGTEPDGQDEFLCPYDFDSTAWQIEDLAARVARFREMAIMDDAIARWLQALKGRQVVLIFDTCHSGGHIDAVELSRMFADESARVRDISQMNTLVITTAMESEVSFGGEHDKPSFLSQYLVEAMNTQPAPVTLQAGFDHYRASMAAMFAAWRTQSLEEQAEKFKQQNIVAEAYAAPLNQAPQSLDNILLPVYLVP